MSKYFQQSFQSTNRPNPESGVETWVDSLNNPPSTAKPMPSNGAAAMGVAALKAVDSLPVNGSVIQQKRIVRRSPADLSVFKDEDSVPQSVVEAYRALRTPLLRAQATKGVRSVVITSSVQGEGKTFTAGNVAVCISQLHNERVLLIDGDLRTGGLSYSYGEGDQPGLAEALEGKMEFGECVMPTKQRNLWFMPAGQSAVAAPELFAGQYWKQFIEWAGSQFTLAIVDAPPITMLAETELIIGGCDAVLAVVRTRTAPREIVEQGAHKIDKQKLLGVVLNCVEIPRASGYGSYYKGYYRAQYGRKK